MTTDELKISEKKEKQFRMITEIQEDIDSLSDERQERCRSLLCKRCLKTIEEFAKYKKQQGDDTI